MKKGFTLIELLAVISLLAIVALIATPIILNVIDDSKESANLRSIEGYARAIKQEYYNQSMDGLTPIIDETFLSNVEKSGGDVVCENILYSSDNGAIMYKCKFKNKGKEYCYADEKHYACDDSEFLEIYEGQDLIHSKSFAEDSWETIAAIVKAGKAEETYNVGDTKEVTIAGYTNGSEQTFTVRIANNTTPSECATEGFSQTACGFVVEFVDIITEHNMNSTMTNIGGWPDSEMYDFINNNIYNALPKELKEVVINTYTVSSHGGNDSSNFISNDKLYLFSLKEVNAIDHPDDNASSRTRPIDYYEKNNSSEFFIKNYRGNANYWWLRSANSNPYYNDKFFFIVTAVGIRDYRNADLISGVAPAFRIG